MVKHGYSPIHVVAASDFDRLRADPSIVAEQRLAAPSLYSHSIIEHTFAPYRSLSLSEWLTRRYRQRYRHSVMLMIL